MYDKPCFINHEDGNALLCEQAARGVTLPRETHETSYARSHDTFAHLIGVWEAKKFATCRVHQRLSISHPLYVHAACRLPAVVPNIRTNETHTAVRTKETNVRNQTKTRSRSPNSYLCLRPRYAWSEHLNQIPPIRNMARQVQSRLSALGSTDTRRRGGGAQLQVTSYRKRSTHNRRHKHIQLSNADHLRPLFTLWCKR